MATNKQIIEFQGKGIAKLKTQYAELEKRTRGLEGATNRGSKSLGGMVAALGLTTAALYAASRAISSTVRVGANFQKTMSNVAAISGATGSQLAALEKNAKDLGASTAFTASQVGELQTEFAKLGFSSKEIQGVTKDTLALAAASGTDLGQAAMIAGQTLRAFGLDVSETSRVTDTMAASFSSSALDMEKFSFSMQYVAPIAKQVGLDVESTTAMLGTLANAGIDGSMAGTALRKIFLELGNETSKLGKKIGFPVKSTEDLEKAFKHLSKQGLDTAAMKELVGQRAVSAFSILLDGVEDTNKLTESLEGASGAAQRMADVQLDNLQGKATILGSAMEGLGISIFERFSPALESSVEGMTSLVGSINNFIKIPTADKIREEQIEFNALIKLLKDTNVNQESRNKHIDTLMTKYPSYIKNLDIESLSVDQLSKLQKEANVQFERNIELKAKEEILAELKQKSLAAQIKVQKQEVLIAKEQDDMLQGMVFAMAGEIDTRQAAIDQENLQEMVLKKLRKEAKDLNEEYRAASEALGHYTQKTDDAKKSTKEFADQVAEGTGGVEPETVDGDDKDITKTQLASLQQFYNERAELTGLDTERQLELLADQTNALTDMYEQQGLDINEVIEFHDLKRRQILQASFQQTLSLYSNMADGFSKFVGEFAGGQKAAARLQQVKALVDAYAAANALMAEPKLVAAFPANIVAAGSALATGLANVMQISKSIGEFKTAATGFDGVVDRPTMFLTGEAGPESVQVTPLNQNMNINGPQGRGVTLNISAPLVDETVVDAIIPAIEKANRMNLA